MDIDEVSRNAKQYSAVKTWIFTADIVLTVLSLAAFQFFLSNSISRLALSIHSNFYIACLIFLSVFLLFMYVVSFPLHFISSFLIEHRFKLSRQSLGSYLADEAKSAALSFLLSAICIQIFYLVLRNFQASWWAIAAAVWIFFGVILARFLPVILIPIFFKYLPIEDKTLKERIMILAKKADISIVSVCKIDFSRKTVKANAALVGLGKTRKVILADTLTEKFTIKEVESVLAHEFGHFKYRHTWQLLAFSGVTTLFGFFILFLVSGKTAFLMGASNFFDLHLLPVVIFLMTVFGICLLPLQNFFSRVLERQADKFALDLTGEPEEFISVMKKLAEINLADTTPSEIKKIFLYSHPPVGERIRMAEEYGVQRS